MGYEKHSILYFIEDIQLWTLNDSSKIWSMKSCHFIFMRKLKFSVIWSVLLCIFKFFSNFKSFFQMHLGKQLFKVEKDYFSFHYPWDYFRISSYCCVVDLERHAYLTHDLALFVTPTSVCTYGVISDQTPSTTIAMLPEPGSHNPVCDGLQCS